MDAVIEIIGELIGAIIIGDNKISTFFRILIVLFVLFAIGFSIYKFFS